MGKLAPSFKGTQNGWLDYLRIEAEIILLARELKIPLGRMYKKSPKLFLKRMHRVPDYIEFLSSKGLEFHGSYLNHSLALVKKNVDKRMRYCEERGAPYHRNYYCMGKKEFEYIVKNAHDFAEETKGMVPIGRELEERGLCRQACSPLIRKGILTVNRVRKGSQKFLYVSSEVFDREIQSLEAQELLSVRRIGEKGAWAKGNSPDSSNSKNACKHLDLLD